MILKNLNSRICLYLLYITTNQNKNQLKSTQSKQSFINKTHFK